MIKFTTIFTHRKEVSDKRLVICKQCEHFDSTFRKCLKCGCFMDAKTLFMDSECPVGKWQAEKDINIEEEQNSKES